MAGASHCDDTRLIINDHAHNYYVSPNDMSVRDDLINIWVSYATNG